MITIDRLKYFLAAAHHQNVSKAAKHLAISPSVISSAVKVLEEELGCELFQREKQRIKLTSKGEVLMEKAQGILAHTQNLYRELSQDSLEHKGHFRIGGSHFLTQELLIPTFLNVQKKNPKVTADLMSFDTAVAIKKVQSGELDLALVFRSSYTSQIEEEILQPGMFQVCVKKSHPLLKLETDKERARALNDLPAITFRSGAQLAGLDFWENHPAFQTLGIIPQHTFFYEDTQTALKLLNQTNGWAFMPDFVVKKSKGLAAVPFKTKLIAPVNISAVWNEQKPPSGFLKQLITQLKHSV